MALECLPSTVKEGILSVLSENGYTTNTDAVLNHVHGDFSSSCHLRVVDGNKEKTLFLKYFSADLQDEYVSEGLLHFKNEVAFYGKLLPLFRNMQNKTNGENCNFVPNCLGVSDTDSKNPFVIMEDLIAEGYVPFSVKEPLLVDKARCVVEQLGKFHAFSFSVKHQLLYEFKEATSKLFETLFRSDTRSTMGKILISSIHDAFKLAKQSLPASSVYVEKFASFTLNIYDKMVTLLADEEDAEYKVLTHGDLWMNNVVFKGDTSDGEVKFVDFQGCRLASPVHDLMFILFVGLDKLTRETHGEDLIRHYHTSLCKTLQSLDCDPLLLFPYSALWNQIMKHSQFVLVLTLAGLPLFLHETDTIQTEEVPNNDGEKSQVEVLFEYLQSNKSMRCKNKMLEIIMYCVDQGFI